MSQDSKNAFVQTHNDLLNVNVSQTERLFGLFSDDHCIYDHERVNGNVATIQDSPSLSEMTRVAIEMLSKNQDKGFFLMVEGGRIDHAHHSTKANAALDETVALDLAVETAFNMTNSDETLIIVTADHGHTMSMSGYADRGEDVRSKSHFFQF